MIRVAVAGALGRMGSLVIEEIKRSDDMELVAGFGRQGAIKMLSEGVRVSDTADLKKVLVLTKPDVLFDFTSASAAVETVCAAAELSINLVVGTTGFTQGQLCHMKKAINGHVAAVISPNFIIGVNVFWRLLAVAAVAPRDNDIEVIEVHHNQKKDAPSGTALAAVDVLKNAAEIEEIVYGRQGTALRGREIGVHAVRAGDVVGDHTVLFAGSGEWLEIRHQAHSRTAFSRGALRAARWVAEAEPGVYSMSDVLG